MPVAVGGFAVGSGDDGSQTSGGGSDALASATLFAKPINDDGDNKLAIVLVTGIIDSLSFPADSPAGWFADEFADCPATTVKQTLAALAEDSDVKGVLLLLNTPGRGTINGSKAISMVLQPTGKRPAGRSMPCQVDRPGGMWSMAGADRIIADEGALVGSIGVIMGDPVYYDDPVVLDGGLFGGGVETRGGIRAIPLSSGEGKDFGNPFKNRALKSLP